MPGWISNAVLIQYSGEEGGHAVAEVLFGDYNPAGRPPAFPLFEAQLPMVYNHKPTGRGMIIITCGLPLFPFVRLEPTVSATGNDRGRKI
jgi:beta-glucosidase